MTQHALAGPPLFMLVFAGSFIILTLGGLVFTLARVARRLP